MRSLDKSIVYADNTVFVFMLTLYFKIYWNDVIAKKKLSLNPSKSDFTVVANELLVAQPQFCIGSDLIK